MQVFISWSGERSRHIAYSFKSWLSAVIQKLEPWVSPDLEKGVAWDTSLAEKLETAGVGIICLTRDNLDSPYIHYEAGSLARSKTQVCTFLYDLKHAEVKQPLARFQHTENTKEDIFKLVTTINGVSEKVGERALPSEALKDAFETYWGRLADELTKTPKLDAAKSAHQRSTNDMLQEVLGTVRNLQLAVQGLRSESRRNWARGIFSGAVQRDEPFERSRIVRPRPDIGAHEYRGPRPPEMIQSGLNGPAGPNSADEPEFPEPDDEKKSV